LCALHPPPLAAGLANGLGAGLRFGFAVGDQRDDQDQPAGGDGEQDPKRPPEAPAVLCFGIGDRVDQDIVAFAPGAYQPALPRGRGAAVIAGD